MDQDGSVGIATGYNFDVWGFDHRWKQDVFSTSVQTDPGSHSASCTMRTVPIPGAKAAVAWLWKHTPIKPPRLRISSAKVLLVFCVRMSFHCETFYWHSIRRYCTVSLSIQISRGILDMWQVMQHVKHSNAQQIREFRNETAKTSFRQESTAQFVQFVTYIHRPFRNNSQKRPKANICIS